MAIRKTKAGSWEVDFRDLQKNRIQKTFQKHRDAVAFHDEVKTKIRSGEYVPPIPKTFREVSEEWIKKKSDRRRSTVVHWRNHIDCHLNPKLGDMRLDKIDVELIEKFSDEWSEKLSPKSVNKILTTATAIFKLAMKYRYVRENPAAEADRKKATTTEDNANGGQVRSDQVYNMGEVKRLIENAEQGLQRAMIMTVCLTGVRHGELLAIRWGDLDLKEGKKLTVRQNLADGDGGPIFNPPKTRSGYREIPLPEELVSELKRWKLQCPPSHYDLVFCNEDGKPLHRKNNGKRGLEPAMRRAGLKGLTMHGLRHTYASLLLANNTPVTEVSYYLGHSSPQVTMTIYAHWCRTIKTDSVSRLAEGIFTNSEEQEGKANVSTMSP